MRKRGTSVWNVWRALIGVGYSIATAFNLIYTLPKADLNSFADNAWHLALASLASGTASSRPE
jgi:hypothetical protein